MKYYLIGLLTLLINLSASSAFSSNFSFMAHSPLQHLTTEDWKIVVATANKALDTYPNHKKATWSNPQSGNSGFIEPIDKKTVKGKTCRDLKLFYNTKYGKEVSTFNFCHYADGWMIPNTDQ